MHRALTISEIVDEIFSYIVEPSLGLAGFGSRPGPPSVTGKTLAALAVTCRTFRDPALAVRWRRLSGLRPLIRLFPRNTWLHDTENDKDVELEFARLPSKEEWINFETYTSRIREITVGSGQFKGIIHFMATLSMKYLPHPSHHLFPKLQSLIWQSQETSQLSLVHLFLPPSLRSLHLGFQDINRLGAPTMLLLLEYQCIMLTHLSVKGLHLGGSVNLAPVLQALKSSSCQQLQSLNLGLVDESILSHLAQLPTLKDLSVQLPDSISTSIASNDGFTSLRTLSFFARNVGDVFLFLQSAQLSLKSIKIQLFENEARSTILPLSSLQQLFSSISNGLCHSSLTQIEINHWTGHRYLDITFDIAILQPLLLFSNLKHLRLDSLFAFNWNDNTLTELVNAWPRLEKLVINHVGWQRSSGINLPPL
ncbi:hypothetical protein BJ138DRAFT_208070 [Hygrophoropsis aurantiaca]|uniref:Uncharacterized protein n=1 Tax=Hygrophoropsis aurantiaca TaxID=72124 RepID=A0ACB8AAC0_9AGAM|nr:hypothetical protein BJ138DRAFT_208070 [Hygrophoropsis aurantiaca]